MTVEKNSIQFLRINKYLNVDMAMSYYITDIHMCIDDFTHNVELTFRLRTDIVPEHPIKVRATMLHRHACVCAVESDSFDTELRCALPAHDYFDFNLSRIATDIYNKLWIAGVGDYEHFSFNS